MRNRGVSYLAYHSDHVRHMRDKRAISSAFYRGNRQCSVLVILSDRWQSIAIYPTPADAPVVP